MSVGLVVCEALNSVNGTRTGFVKILDLEVGGER